MWRFRDSKIFVNEETRKIFMDKTSHGRQKGYICTDESGDDITCEDVLREFDAEHEQDEPQKEQSSLAHLLITGIVTKGTGEKFQTDSPNIPPQEETEPENLSIQNKESVHTNIPDPPKYSKNITEKLTIRIDKETKRMLSQKAQKNTMSKSEYIRSLIINDK